VLVCSVGLFRSDATRKREGSQETSSTNCSRNFEVDLLDEMRMIALFNERLLCSVFPSFEDKIDALQCVAALNNGETIHGETGRAA
jgi:hypothetical protein